MPLANVSLREAVATDTDALTRLARRTYADAYAADMPPDSLEAHLESALSDARISTMLAQDQFLVAVHAQQLIGFVQYGEFALAPEAILDPGQSIAGDNHPTRSLAIRRLYIDAAWQNLRIGSELLGAIIDTAFRQSTPSLFLEVWHTNLAAQRFYRRFGFSRVGQVSFIQFDGSLAGHDLLFQKKLL